MSDGARHANAAIFVPHEGCPHKCSFCNQRHISGTAILPDAEYVRKVCAGADAERFENAEIAFFGGSFTAIDRSYMISLLSAAAPFVGAGGFSGIRISTRPDAVDEDVLRLLGEYGVTAVELGAQSMDDSVLLKNERGHKARDIRRASAMISEAGMSLGLQMMTGLYGSDDVKDRYTAQELAALKPDTMRIYPTIVVEHTRLAELYRAGVYMPQSLDSAAELCAELMSFFEREKGIPVIRLGLHAQDTLESNYVAGPWHPAFRELCEGLIYRRLIEELLTEASHGELAVRVHPSAVSRAVGHRRGNAEYFGRRGVKLKIIADEKVAKGTVI